MYTTSFREWTETVRQTDRQNASLNYEISSVGNLTKNDPSKDLVFRAINGTGGGHEV
jgi:hypothetical protein